MKASPGVVLASEGSGWASPAMNYLGPGWRDVAQHHGDNDAGDFLPDLKAVSKPIKGILGRAQGG